MAINNTGATPVPLTVFGSWVTEVAPEALPEGVSPDCADVVFLPGSVGQRPGLQRIAPQFTPIATGDSLSPTVVYQKSFVTPTGAVKKLSFDSNGGLYVEDLAVPGVRTLLLASFAGSMCRSMTFDGREYIAISDGLHGMEVPLQYDGTYLDRFTMDGPGVAPSVANLQLLPVALVTSGNGLARNANTVTATTVSAHGLQVGYQVQISAVPDSNASTVNQTNSSQSVIANNSYWSLNSGAWRSLFNPGTSPLSAFYVDGFGFNVPSNATVLGVIVSFAVASQSSTTGTVSQVALWNNGSQLGTAKTPGTAITTTFTTETYGSASDGWAASLTPAIVNSYGFGFAVACSLDSTRAFLSQTFTVTVYYTLSGAGTVATIATIVIDNESNPGLALVTTTGNHGLSPEEFVSIVGVQPATVANVSAAQWAAGKTTLTTTTSHNIFPGAVIQVAAVTTSTSGTQFSFNGTFTVENTPTPNQICYYQTPVNSSDPDVINATANTGNITIAWPVPDNTPTPNYFQVDSCPSPTTFQVPLNYSNGTWTSGTVGFIWNGIYYVSGILSATQFTYYQPGPNGSTSAGGLATPYGQAAPGLHLLAVAFQRRQGGITKFSPFVTFTAQGGQYVSLTGIPIGPADTVARIIVVTGAQPLLPSVLPPFFYINYPAQVEGRIISTGTVIYDNTTTSAVLDFSDTTLYASTGVSLPGNDLAGQVVLEGALAFGSYDGRLTAWGQRNRLQNFVNLGFDGGFLPVPGTPNSYPAGWTYSGTPTPLPTMTVTPGRVGGFQTNFLSFNGAASPSISQSAYQDCFGNPILAPNTLYKVRLFIAPSGAPSGSGLAGGLSVTLTCGSVSLLAGFGNSTVFNYVAGYYEATFNGNTPNSIPSSSAVSMQYYGNPFMTLTFGIDEVSIVPANEPYLDQTAYASYASNPEGIHGSTGVYGPVNDTRKLMDQFILNDTLYMVTQDPSGALHETNGSTTAEPSGWQVNQVDANCGLLSAFGLARSQADDAIKGGGDRWAAWASEAGVIIFGGGQPTKISQEIQPSWYDPSNANVSVQINMAAAASIWAVNDPAQRLLMFGVPIGTATAPNKIYVLSYRNLGNAEAIESSPPFHPSFSGKLVATDNSRKWTQWNIQANGAARVYLAPGQLSLVLFGGNGQAPGSSAGYGYVYQLNPTYMEDDDYGLISSYYTTCFIVDPEKAQALQLPQGRLMVAFLTGFVSGSGNFSVQIFCNSLANPWLGPQPTRILSASPAFDFNLGGSYAQGERFAFRFSAASAGSGGSTWNVSRFCAYLREAALAIRGAAQ